MPIALPGVMLRYSVVRTAYCALVPVGKCEGRGQRCASALLLKGMMELLYVRIFVLLGAAGPQ